MCHTKCLELLQEKQQVGTAHTNTRSDTSVRFRARLFDIERQTDEALRQDFYTLAASQERP
jgi:hypothetical protein